MINSSQVKQCHSEESSDLWLFISEMAERRWWLCASVIISTTLFVVAGFIIQPVYRAVTVLIPASAERNSVSGALNSVIGQFGGLASFAGIGGNSGDVATDEALAVLRSRQFTENFIHDMNIMPELYSGRWDATKGAWRAEGAPSPARAFKYFSKIRTISQDKKTGLVTIQIEWKDRNRAAEWVNEIAKRINAEMRERAIEKADAALHFLQKELLSTSTVEVRDSINRLIEAQIKQRMLANVTDEYAFRVVDKAMAPDSDDPIRPQKLLLFMLGPLVGLSFGIVGVLAANLFFTRSKVGAKR